MTPTWERLRAVAAYESGLIAFLKPRLKGLSFDAVGATEANRLCAEFGDSWPYYLPTIWELVLADRAGVLDEKLAELDSAFWADWGRRHGGGEGCNAGG